MGSRVGLYPATIITTRRRDKQLTKPTLKGKGLTPTACANLYLRYCLQNLPEEVADIAPLNSTQYKAVQKALQGKLAGLIKKLDKSLGGHAPGTDALPEVQVPEYGLIDSQNAI